jgi:glycosyltransferase involved in cell wall biosynthesis
MMHWPSSDNWRPGQHQTAKGAPVFLDITTMICRGAIRYTPTGIARVEVAYAQELLRRYPDQIHFVVALHRMVQVIPTHVVAAFLKSLQAMWRDNDPVERQAIARLVGFLNAPQSLFGSTEIEVTESNPAFLSAAMMIRAMLQTIRPRNLSRFSNAQTPSIYIHVSGSIIPTPWIQNWLKRSPSVKGLFLLHDLIPLTHPEYVTRKAFKRHKQYIQRLAEAADVIVTNSADTANIFRRISAEMDIPTPQLFAAPLGPSLVPMAQPPRWENAAPYFVYVSTIEPRKNHIMLLRVWEQLLKKYGSSAPKLVLVGRRGWQIEGTTSIIDNNKNLKAHVLECNDLGDRALATLILNARATLMPSHAEGFGLPVAESLHLKTPVICSDLTVFREIAGNVPEYADPTSGGEWARIITDYARFDSTLRKAQMQRLSSYKPPTWHDHFEKVSRVLEMLSVAEAAETITKQHEANERLRSIGSVAKTEG